MNHKFREEQPSRWRNQKSFTCSMRAPDLKNDEMLANQISEADPYNVGNQVGSEQIKRKRLKEKELTKKPFDPISRAKSREDAKVAQAQQGSIRQLRNVQARTMLKQYDKDGDCPNVSNSSYMKQNNTQQSQAGI